MNYTQYIESVFSLRGKVAVVTGGNTGLGRVFSSALAKAGANVVVASESEDKTIIDEINELGVEAFFVQSDITAQGAAQQIVDEAMRVFGRVDILVNNAGICINKNHEEFSREDWDPMLGVNLTAAFDLIKAVSQVMVTQKSGKIINICSLFSYLGGQNSPAYAATKHGIAGLTKAYCDELGQHNIQVNGIAPGYYATAVTTETRNDPKRNQRVLDHIPAGKWGDLEDLAGTIIYLAGRGSDYVNGHIVAVDGGYLVR